MDLADIDARIEAEVLARDLSASVVDRAVRQLKVDHLLEERHEYVRAQR